MGTGWVGGERLGGVMVENNATLWLHLASCNLQYFQLSWKSEMWPSVTIIILFHSTNLRSPPSCSLHSIIHNYLPFTTTRGE